MSIDEKENDSSVDPLVYILHLPSDMKKTAPSPSFCIKYLPCSMYTCLGLHLITSA